MHRRNRCDGHRVASAPMRTHSDLPPRQRRRARRPRAGWSSSPVAVIARALLLSARFLAGFYVDYLWHQQRRSRRRVLGRAPEPRSSLFAMFAGAFIAIAVRQPRHRRPARAVGVLGQHAPRRRAVPRDLRPSAADRAVRGRRRRRRCCSRCRPSATGRSGCCSATASRSASTTPQFGNDIGFYIFRLPFITFVLDWLFAAVVFIIVLVVVTHVLNGGVVLQPPRPKVRRATKAHVAVLLGAARRPEGRRLLGHPVRAHHRASRVRAGRHVLGRQRTAAGRRAARCSIALLVAGLFLSHAEDRLVAPADRRLGAVGRRSRSLGGVIYPAAIQALVVNPNQKDREARLHRAQHRRHPRTRSASTTCEEQTVTVEPISVGATSSPTSSALQRRAPAQPGHAGRPVPHRRGPAIRADDQRPRHRPVRHRRS